jgi:hypothetical protein
MSNGKRKGNKAERELAKWWKTWSGFEFTRVPASGGLRWKTMVNTTTSDLICADDRHNRRFQFSIESKSYKDINFEHLILGNKNSAIRNFWDQCNTDAERSNKVPILFMRYNGMSKNTWFVVMPSYVYNLFFPTLVKFDHNRFVVSGPDNIVIMNSNDLLKTDYMKLHLTLKKLRKNDKAE